MFGSQLLLIWGGVQMIEQIMHIPDVTQVPDVNFRNVTIYYVAIYI